MTEPSFRVIRFADHDEAAAFVAALKRFLGYPQGSPHRAQAQVWQRRSAAGGGTEILLNDRALEAATAAFGPIPLAGKIRPSATASQGQRVIPED